VFNVIEKVEVPRGLRLNKSSKFVSDWKGGFIERSRELWRYISIINKMFDFHFVFQIHDKSFGANER
jgi:hypothetical protein